MAIPLLNVVRELFDRFPNDLQTPGKGALQRFIAQKGLLLQPLCLAYEMLGLSENVLEIGPRQS